MRSMIRAALALAFAALCASPAGAVATIVKVSTDAELTAAIAAAVKAGAETSIRLAPGSYAPLTLSGVRTGRKITITSQDLKRRAVLGRVKVANSAQLLFQGLEFAFAAAPNDVATNAFGIDVRGSDHVRLKNVEIHGAEDGDPSNDIVGVYFQNSSFSGLYGSDLHDLRVGAVLGSSTDMEILDNNLHDIRIDGVDLANVKRVMIKGNTCRRFRHLGLSGFGGDHSDCFQALTLNQPAGTEDVSIIGNLVDVDAAGGGKPMQGVWLDDAGNRGHLRVVVKGNLLVDTNWTAIGLINAPGAVVDGNTAVSIAGRLDMNGTPVKVRIRSQGPAIALGGVNQTPVLSEAEARALVAAWLAAH